MYSKEKEDGQHKGKQQVAAPLQTGIWIVWGGIHGYL